MRRKHGSIDSASFLGTAGVDLSLGMAGQGTDTRDSAGAGHGHGHRSLAADPSGLDRKRLAHDGASLPEELELGDSAAALRGLGASGR